MRIEDEAILEVFRNRACEICGQPAPSNPHHVYARGIGGGARLDMALNLLSLCGPCHMYAHNGMPPRKQLWEVVAAREGLESGEQAKDAVWRLLRKTC